MTKVGNNSEYKNAMVDYLQSISWTFFFTGTTGYDLTLKSARRLADRFFEGFKKDGDVFFWVAERFECKDGFHIHGLMKVQNQYGELDPENKMLYRSLLDQWQSSVGNKALSNQSGSIAWNKWSRVDLQAYDAKRGATGYCGKYILKKGADYDLLC
jgi:hypothetical protein